MMANDEKINQVDPVKQLVDQTFLQLKEIFNQRNGAIPDESLIKKCLQKVLIKYKMNPS